MNIQKIKVSNANNIQPIKVKNTQQIIINMDLQDKVVIPTQEQQVVKPDLDFDALSKVVVEPIPDNYIEPTGEKEININGIHDIKEYETVNVKIDPNLQDKEVTVKPLEKKYVMADEGYDGLGIVNVTGTVDTENIEVTPTKETQTINRSENKYIESITVNPIPIEYIVPSGELEITKNGQYNVVDKESVNVDVQPNLGTKTISENGVYNATDDNLDGYSQISVETGGGSIDEYISTSPTTMTNYSGVGSWMTCVNKLPALEISGKTDLKYLFAYFQGEELDVSKIDTTGVTSMQYMFNYSDKLKRLNLSNFDTSNVKNMATMFGHMTSIRSIGPGEEYDVNIENFDTSNVTTMNSLLSWCSGLQNVNLSGFNTQNVTTVSAMFEYNQALVDLDISNFDLSKATTVSYMLRNCTMLKNLNFAKNVGKGFETSRAANYYGYTIDVSTSTSLTHDSLMSIINNIYDIASLGCNTQKLVLGSSNKAKLTEEEMAIATNKGWTVS